ncbi:hypothetical protein ABZ636_19430 [Streptomyces sp. NPDC007251]
MPATSTSAEDVATAMYEALSRSDLQTLQALTDPNSSSCSRAPST